MLRPQFVVLESDHGWRISHDGRHYGPYPNQRSAILAAIDAADRSPSTGFLPRVLTQSRSLGKVQIEWTQGDPYPVDLEAYRESLVQVREEPGRHKWFAA